MQTPIYKFEPTDYDVVYEPAEDTFLLLDALEDELEDIGRRQPLLCVEIGPGSGVIITALRQSLSLASKVVPHCLGFDINPAACRMTHRTSALNGAAVDAINMDLLGGLRSHTVDLLVFNPPYVPTQPASSGSLEEHIGEFRRSEPLTHSWAGGADGRAVTDRVVADLKRILAPGGLLYLLLVKENKPQEVLRCVERLGFRGTIVKERRIRGEHLFVLRICETDAR
ncbi:methyltransferase N6AMT1 [Anopheles bellator]|uniref:methyltransferase N6AMT1 n=1 Tax=Anopheles bellator TaxID=139047 RepID=UPI002648C3E7|nr:methyltransferase N6AMT1 [Anopheles bellator]